MSARSAARRRTDRGTLVDGVEQRIRRLRETLEVRLLSADTFGGLDAVAGRLSVEAERISRGPEKRAYGDRPRIDATALVGLSNLY